MGGSIVCMLDDDAGCGVTDKGGSAPAPPQLPAEACAPFAVVTKYPPLFDEDGFGRNPPPG